MDQNLDWWVNVVFDGWRERRGPRYQRLAAALLHAVETRSVAAGARVPPERVLADALGVSRGTVVACLDQLVEAGVVRRRQGAGTFVTGRRDWTSEPSSNPAAGLLVRHLAVIRDSVDLSVSVPPSTAHLPDVGRLSLASLDGDGLDPAGVGEVREVVAEHLNERQGIPARADELVVTAGAQQALALVAAVAAAPTATIVAGCPTYPGLLSAFAGRRAKVVSVSGDGAAGMDVDEALRACRASDNPLLYVASVGSNPTGSVMPTPRAESVAEAAASGRVVVVDDLVLADLRLDDERVTPVASLSDKVVAIGSVSKLMWGGLRVGWIRAPEPMRSSIVAMKAAMDLATSALAQHATAALLRAVDSEWIGELCAALRFRRDRVASSIVERMPSWRPAHPRAGLSLWVDLPLTDADAFVHVAAEHGVRVAPGSAMCICGGKHRGAVRLSLAEPVDVLDLAVERLAVAWRAHSESVAALPSRAR